MTCLGTCRLPQDFTDDCPTPGRSKKNYICEKGTGLCSLTQTSVRLIKDHQQKESPHPEALHPWHSAANSQGCQVSWSYSHFWLNQEQTCGQHSQEGHSKLELLKKKFTQLPYTCEGQVLQFPREAPYWNIPPVYETRTLNATSTNWKWYSEEWHHLSRTILIGQVAWQQYWQISVWILSRKVGYKASQSMLFRIVNNLVGIPATPFLVPMRTPRRHSMKIFIPQSTVNSNLYTFPEHHHAGRMPSQPPA